MKEEQKCKHSWIHYGLGEYCSLCGIDKVYSNKKLYTEEEVKKIREEALKDILKYVEDQSGLSGRKEIVSYIKFKLEEVKK